MPEATHTPGPWVIFNENSSYIDIGREIDSSTVPQAIPGERAFVLVCRVKKGIDGEANARLIASAPELSEALAKAKSETPQNEQIKAAPFDILTAGQAPALARLKNRGQIGLDPHQYRDCQWGDLHAVCPAAVDDAERMFIAFYCRGTDGLDDFMRMLATLYDLARAGNASVDLRQRADILRAAKVIEAWDKCFRDTLDATAGSDPMIAKRLRRELRRDEPTSGAGSITE